MILATLPETKAALLIDHVDDDSTLTLLIRAASDAVLSYLKVPSFDVIPDRAKVATILLVGKLYDRDEKVDPFAGDKLPTSVLALLAPLRFPTLA